MGEPLGVQVAKALGRTVKFHDDWLIPQWAWLPAPLACWLPLPAFATDAEWVVRTIEVNRLTVWPVESIGGWAVDDNAVYRGGNGSSLGEAVCRWVVVAAGAKILLLAEGQRILIGGMGVVTDQALSFLERGVVRSRHLFLHQIAVAVCAKCGAALP